MNLFDDIKALTGNKTSSSQELINSSEKTVLIVEDEKPLAEILGTRLKEAGYNIMMASNGREGLEKADEHMPNVIILDLLMPVMDGKLMLQILRKTPKFKNLPVIVLTNAGEVDNIRETQRYFDAVEFLIKSNVSLEDILATVKRVAW